MVGVSKIHKPNKTVLKDIYLSFFYGAKIGVLGLNGAGKSTLLRIIAGEDKDYIGDISVQKGIRASRHHNASDCALVQRGAVRIALHQHMYM